MAGQILGMVGTNGSGKTTLMRVISGIYPLEYGTIQADDPLRITPIFALRSGMRPLFTGRENIYIKGAMYGLSQAELDDKLKFIADFSGLEEYLDTPFGNYSSGMKTRLAFSIAIATEPNIFIIDEALAVGDEVFKAKCFRYLQNYVTKPRRAVLFISNSIDKVYKVANRLIVLKKGTIIHDTTDVKMGLKFYIENCINDPSQAEQARDILSVLN
ncbi:UNVERIFIED_CONTAM: hypothetical protein GTU68_021102 [Idotea baltica]|nr:hypothetical protein [Idotea baltica]